VSDGVARAVVVTDDHPSEQIESAADLLIETVQTSTGITLGRIGLSDARGSALSKIYVGVIGPDSRPGSQRSLASVGADGFTISSIRDSVTIIGPSDWGTRHGVLEFCERYIGARWLMPGDAGEDVPPHDDIAVPWESITDGPALISRVMAGVTTVDPFAPDWKSSNPQSLWSSRARLREYIRHSHNLWRIFPPATFAASHPEYYPVIDGVRRIPADSSTSGWQPRFSEPGTIDVAVNAIISGFDANPEMPSYSLAVNDSNGFSDEDLGSSPDPLTGQTTASEAYFSWVNAVVERVLERRPDLAEKWFGVLAYGYVAGPPSFRLHPRVVPYLTNDRYGWVDRDYRAYDNAVTAAWVEVAQSGLGYYDYVYGGPYAMPRLYIDEMSAVYKYAQEHGVISQTSELYPNWGEGLKAWVYAKLLWNPNADVIALAAEWCERAVGPAAAGHLAAYFDLWESVWRDRVPDTLWFRWIRDDHKPFFYFMWPDYLEAARPSDAAAARAHLQAALDNTSTDAQRQRAKMIMKSFNYYESAVISFPRDVPAAKDADAAMSILDGVDGSLSTRTQSAMNMLEAVADLDSDPVLRLPWPPTNYAYWWSGFNGSELFGVVDYLVEHEPYGGKVTDRLAAMADGPDSDAPARYARLALKIASGSPGLAVNPSFEDGVAGWTARFGFEASNEFPHSGSANLRLRQTSGADLRQRVALSPGLLATRIYYYTPIGARGFATLTLVVYDPAGVRIGSWFQRIREFRPTGGRWSYLALLEDIPATFKGRTVGAVEPVFAVADFDDPNRLLYVDDFTVYGEAS
jgi:hypothetical protein